MFFTKFPIFLSFLYDGIGSFWKMPITHGRRNFHAEIYFL